MPNTSFVQTSFLGGEWSKLAKGRTDRPDYRSALTTCRNGLPIESGAWVRRSGFRQLAFTRAGLPARLIKYDFQGNRPYWMEFTDGYLRFLTGSRLAHTNDDKVVSTISTANPCVVTTTGNHGWSAGDVVEFQITVNYWTPLHGRQFTIAINNATQFSLSDPITGATIDGSTLGTAPPLPITVKRVAMVATPYTGGRWATTRAIQTADQAFLLNAGFQPRILTPSVVPTADLDPGFALTTSNFQDGPYLDPIKGLWITPSAKTGVITLDLLFQTYDATVSYNTGDYARFGGTDYVSIADANFNNEPDISPSYWTATSPGVAISPVGFQATDIGRHIRLASEPPLWASGTTYAAGNPVTYNGTYWSSLVGSNTGNAPGIDLTHWSIMPNGLQWSWGKITALTNLIDRALAGSVNIGNMTANGGLAASFDGISNSVAAACSQHTPSAPPYSSYVGKDYSGASNQTIAQATVYPSSDFGWFGGGSITTITINLRASQTAPVLASDGTLLGTTGSIANSTSSQSITSNDTTTAWKYIWVELVTPINRIHFVAELVFNKPSGTATGTEVSFQILGPPLLYTTPCRLSRLGVYADSTGWPTTGCYHEGRIWLGGVVPNRFDASVSGSDQVQNFAPTDTLGNVLDSSAISYTMDAEDSNELYWLAPDGQGIIAGTLAGEWLISASTQNQALTPSNITAHRVTKIKCANILPVRTDHTLAFVQAHGRKVQEYFADVYSGKFSSPNLTAMAKHLTSPGLAELAYQYELAPLLWARDGDGNLLSCTYKRDSLTVRDGPTFAGWAKHTHGLGRTFTSIAAGPSGSGTLDTLAAITYDPGTTYYTVEILQDLFEEGDTLLDANYVDGGIVPTSYGEHLTSHYPDGITFYGLWGLNGETVDVWAGGLDCGSFTVSAGSVTVPFGDGIQAGAGLGQFTKAYVDSFNGGMVVIIGASFTSKGQQVRAVHPQEAGTQFGPGFAKFRRAHFLGVLLEASKGLYVGPDFNTLRACQFQTDGGTALTALQTFSGTWRQTIDGVSNFDGEMCWQISRPYPCQIAAMGPFLSTADT